MQEGGGGGGGNHILGYSNYLLVFELYTDVHSVSQNVIRREHGM